MNTVTDTAPSGEGDQPQKAPPTGTGRKTKKKATEKGTAAKPAPVPTAPATTPEPTKPDLAPPNDEGTSVDLVELFEANTQGTGTAGPVLEVVRLGTDETPIIPFTAKGKQIAVHYCAEPEINGYAQCIGSGCVLCKIGRKRDERILIPVYLPAAGTVGVLPVSPALRPHALYPQLANVMKAGKPVVAFITRDRDRYTVSTTAIGPDTDAGEAVVKAFLAEQAAGRVKPASVIASFTNEQLAGVPAVARMLALKGAA